MLNNRDFISKNHTLIVFDEIRGKQYPLEIERRKTFATIDHVIAELGDETVQVLRMIDHAAPDAIEATENFRVEDITEDCAKAWIAAHQMRDDIENVRPLYVQRSQAWSDWEDGRDDGTYRPAATWGTYNTLHGSVN